ncbi:hypothetical protein R1sor_017371 [Riccia sorocarpa]|uniref:RING-type domain-containing protein n=1 Tax=Riccia sorocarpa TaxID=122646 RepID=A0ABD3ICX0_9MARC
MSEIKLKPSVEPDRPVHQATGTLGAVHDILSGGPEVEARNSSPEPEPVKKKLEPGSEDTEWTEDVFILSVEYFANECKLPNDGLMPNDIPKSLVSDDVLKKCFGPRYGNKGRNGPKINNCTGLPQLEVLHLFRERCTQKPSVQRSADVNAPVKAERTVLDWTEIAPKVEGRNFTKLGETSAPEGSTSEGRISRSNMPGVPELKADILDRQRRIKALQDEVITLRDIVDNNRKKLDDAEQSILGVEDMSKKEKLASNQLVLDRLTVEKEKQTLETRLDDGGFDEENPEDIELLSKLEQDEEELNTKFSAVLSALEESERRLLQLIQQSDSIRATIKKLESLNMEEEAEISKKVLTVEREESILESQLLKVKMLDPVAEMAATVRSSPKFVPTSTEVTKTVFRLTSCPVCSFGFHCNNFMAASCGHAYHPACLMAVIAKINEPMCIECDELLHPHWCESWGIETTEDQRQKWEAEVGLQKQRDAFGDSICNIYQKIPQVLRERRMAEKEKCKRIVLKYTASGVERSSAISSATAKVRAHILARSNPDYEALQTYDHQSCRSTIRSSLTDGKDEDISVVDVNVPLTRSKKGKRPSS